MSSEGARQVSNLDDVIDSRGVIERLAELIGLTERDSNEGDELSALQALVDEAAGYSEDWAHGVTLVRDSYFTEYARDFAQDVIPLYHERPETQRWPFNCIDWDQAARELRMDYTSVDFAGVTYWVR